MTTEYESTYHGLENWFSNLFERLGWMVLAKEHHDANKLQCYIDSIDKWTRMATHKRNDTKYDEKREDLDIMLRKMTVLTTFVRKNLFTARGAKSKTKTQTKTRSR